MTSTKNEGRESNCFIENTRVTVSIVFYETSKLNCYCIQTPVEDDQSDRYQEEENDEYYRNANHVRK